MDDPTRDDELTVIELVAVLEEWGSRAKGRGGVDVRSLRRTAERRNQHSIERERRYMASKRAEAEGWRRVEEEEMRVEEERDDLERKREEKELEGLDGKFELVEAEK